MTILSTTDMSHQERTPLPPQKQAIPRWLWLLLGVLFLSNLFLAGRVFLSPRPAYPAHSLEYPMDTAAVEAPNGRFDSTKKEKNSLAARQLLLDLPMRLATLMPSSYSYAGEGDRLYFGDMLPLGPKKVSVSDDSSGEISVKLFSYTNEVMQEQFMAITPLFGGKRFHSVFGFPKRSGYMRRYLPALRLGGYRDHVSFGN